MAQNPLYAYGTPVLVTGSGSPQVTTGELENGGTNGTPHTPPTNVSTVVVPGGSTSDELSTMYTPVLGSISPTTVVKGVANTLVTCTGSNFQPTTSERPGTRVTNNGVEMATNYVSATSLTYTMPHSTVTTAGTVTVNVSTLGIPSATPKTFTYT